MPSIFGDNEGKLVAMAVTGGMPAVVRLAGFSGSPLLIMSVGFGQQANVQFMHTLRDVIYIYAFGERMGTVKVSGLLIFRACSGGSTPVKDLIGYYKTNSVSLNGSPISISVGGEALKGFLMSVEFGGFDQVLGTATFSLTFASLPAGYG